MHILVLYMQSDTGSEAKMYKGGYAMCTYWCIRSLMPAAIIDAVLTSSPRLPDRACARPRSVDDRHPACKCEQTYSKHWHRQHDSCLEVAPPADLDSLCFQDMEP